MASPIVKRYNHGQPGEEGYGYTQVVQVGSTVYLSGQLSLDANGQLLHPGDFAAQVKCTFENVDKCLAAVGAKRSHVVNERVFIVDLPKNALIYQTLRKQYFSDHTSASTVIGVAGLGASPDQLVEVAVTLDLSLDSTEPNAPVVKRYAHDLLHEKPYGYTQVLQVGNTVHISGQYSHDDHDNFVGVGDFQAQIDQTYANLDKCLAAIGASRRHIVNEHVFIVDSVQNAPKFGASHKKYYGDHLTTSTLMGVTSLLFPEVLIEIGVTLQLDIGSVQVKRFTHGLESEKGYGFTQVLQVGETVHISGQLALMEEDKMEGVDDLTEQIKLTYKNIDKCLASVGATRNQIVVEDVFIMDGINCQDVFNPLHREFYGTHRTTSNYITVPGIYYPEQLLEIAVTARLDIPK